MKKLLIAVLVSLVFLAFPFILNWALQKDAFVPVIGDGTAWLSFWPVYLSAIASFGMIYFTYRTLQQNKEQLEEIKRQREEDERARLVFSVIVYQSAFFLKMSNIGKRNVYEATIQFNEDFLNELLEEKFQEGYRQLGKSFFVEAGTSREEINMNLFLDKTFMVVQGELETTLGYIKKGLVVQNSSYMPVQRSLDQIAKNIVRVNSSFESIAENLEEIKNEKKAKAKRSKKTERKQN